VRCHISQWVGVILVNGQDVAPVCMCSVSVVLLVCKVLYPSMDEGVPVLVFEVVLAKVYVQCVGCCCLEHQSSSSKEKQQQ
jgi:hypothetical protein